jgi:hypothetical protein
MKTTQGGRMTKDISFFSKASRPAIELIQLPVQLITGTISPEVKQPLCEADHCTPSSFEVKNVCIYTSTPLHAFVVWYLIKNV